MTWRTLRSSNVNMISPSLKRTLLVEGSSLQGQQPRWAPLLQLNSNVMSTRAAHTGAAQVPCLSQMNLIRSLWVFSDWMIVPRLDHTSNVLPGEQAGKRRKLPPFPILHHHLPNCMTFQLVPPLMVADSL